MKEQEKISSEQQSQLSLDPIKQSPMLQNSYKSFKINPKSSLCRFYLRGNCPQSSQSCYFAHGIQELNFRKYDPGEEQQIKQLYYNFRIQHPLNQLDIQVCQQNKNYINLYEFQSLRCQQNGKSLDPSQFHPNGKEISIKKSEQKKQVSKKRGEYNHKNKHKNLNQDQQALQNQETSQYSQNKKYALEQINSNRNLKIEIRKHFHQNQLKLFLELIQRAYSSKTEEDNKQEFRFSHQILEIEYYRAGFNKLMTRIKISFLFDYLIYQHKGGHFKFTSIMPPLKNRPTTFYLKMGQDEKTLSHYQSVYAQTQKLFKSQNRTLREQDIRQAMIKSMRSWWCIPPITQVLRLKHCTFKQFFINYILKLNQSHKENEAEKNTASFDWITDEQIQIAKIHQIIEMEIKKKQYCLSTYILTQSPKFNRALIEKCVLSQRKQAERLYAKEKNQQQPQKLILIKCPNIKTEVITKQSYLKPQNKYEYQFGIKLQILIQDIIEFALEKLTLQSADGNSQPSEEQNFNKQILKQLITQVEEQRADRLEEYKIIQIRTAQELLLQKEILLKSSTIVGVDLEGSLSDCQNGYLSLIQINSFSHKIVYLIDYLTINKQETQEGIQVCKSILTQLFNDQNIVKIIHDSRNDAECLYYLLKKRSGSQKVEKETKDLIKLTNIFDTAASEQVIRQVQGFSDSKIATPGLNQVLQKYKQTKNRLKQKYHSIWAEGKSDPSTERPMSQEFKEYCSMDVIGLPKVYIAMSKIVNPYFLVLISQFHADWSQNKESKELNHEKMPNNTSTKQNQHGS